MKVCYIITTTTNSGPVNVLYNQLVNYQQISDFKPTIITLKPDDVSKSRYNQFEKLGIEIKHFYNYKTQYKDILNFINVSEFDVIHSHGLFPDLINSYVLKHEKKHIFHITTQHNYPFEDYPQRRGKIIGNLMAIMQIYAIKNLYKVSCSNAIAEKFANIGIKTDVVQNGIIFPKSYIQNEVTDIHRPIFLYLGRIHDRKNVPFLIKYFQYHPEYEFWIVGDGAKYESVKKIAQSIENIKVLGKTETPEKFYIKADYYISASKSEGLPLSVLEAMSYGMPCIISKIAPHDEILENENLGMTFINNDIDSLNNSIGKLLNQNCDRQLIYKEAKNKFDASVMMNNYVDIYNKNILGDNE